MHFLPIFSCSSSPFNWSKRSKKQQSSNRSASLRLFSLSRVLLWMDAHGALSVAPMAVRSKRRRSRRRGESVCEGETQTERGINNGDADSERARAEEAGEEEAEEEEEEGRIF